MNCWNEFGPNDLLAANEADKDKKKRLFGIQINAGGLDEFLLESNDRGEPSEDAGGWVRIL